jgi:hypothetical protein
MGTLGIIGWKNPFKKGGPFRGPRTHDGEQEDETLFPTHLPKVEEIKGPPSTKRKSDHPPIFAPKL